MQIIRLKQFPDLRDVILISGVNSFIIRKSLSSVEADSDAKRPVFIYHQSCISYVYIIIFCSCSFRTLSHLCSLLSALSGCNENDTDHLDRDQQAYPPTQKTKRMRTSFKHHQLRTMKSYFAINHNPDAKDLKQLAQKTGLTKRVLQVSTEPFF